MHLLPTIGSPGTQLRSHEDGFTLIEILIATFLFAVVLGGVVFALAGLFGSAGSSQANRTAKADVAQAVTQLTSDLQRARADDRTTQDIRYSESLFNGIARGKTLYSEDPQSDPPGRELMIDDIVRADPKRLDFMADVVPSKTEAASAECVSWTIGETVGKTGFFDVSRKVYGDAIPPTIAAGTQGSCTGTLIEERVMIRSSIRDGIPDAFSFNMTCLPSACEGEPAAASGAGCGTWNSDSPSARELRWISSVQAQFGTLVKKENAGNTIVDTATVVTLRTRTTSEYRQAAGCA
jgi:prepilin-type N-terminal cleavage/methylation domain-containing protein